MIFAKLPHRYHSQAQAMRDHLLARVSLQGSKTIRYAALYGMSWERICSLKTPITRRGVRRKGATPIVI